MLLHGSKFFFFFPNIFYVGFSLCLCCPLPSNTSHFLITPFRINAKLVLIYFLQWIRDSTPWQTVWAVLLIICGTLCTLHHHGLWTKYVSRLSLWVFDDDACSISFIERFLALPLKSCLCKYCRFCLAHDNCWKNYPKSERTFVYVGS